MTFPDDTCDQSKKDKLSVEFENANTMANLVAVDLLDGEELFPDRRMYYNTFMAQEDRDTPGFQAKIKAVYDRIGFMTDPSRTETTFPITCSNAANSCGPPNNFLAF